MQCLLLLSEVCRTHAIEKGTLSASICRADATAKECDAMRSCFSISTSWLNPLQHCCTFRNDLRHYALLLQQEFVFDPEPPLPS